LPSRTLDETYALMLKTARVDAMLDNATIAPLTFKTTTACSFGVARRVTNPAIDSAMFTGRIKKVSLKINQASLDSPPIASLYIFTDARSQIRTSVTQSVANPTIVAVLMDVLK